MLKPRVITTDEKQGLIDLPDNHIGNATLVKLFSHYYSNTDHKTHDPHYQPFDILTVNPGDLKCIHSTMETTVGLFLFNKYIIDGTGLHKAMNYINKSMNGRDLEDLDDEIAHLFLLDKIDVNIVNRYLTVRDAFLSMVYQIILPSLSENIMRVHPLIEKKKDELLKQYQKEIEDGDLVTMNKVTKELVDYARDILQDDESMILYMSGSRPEFANNYRVLSIMKGPVKNETTGKFEFVTSSLVGGISKHDIPSGSNGILAAEYPTAIGTAESGYQGKKILYFMQGEVVGEKGSDCGTKATLKMVATKQLANQYRYFVENGELKLLSPDNISQYQGKILNFRSPMGCCRNGGPCNICAGDYIYMLGVSNIGIIAHKISGFTLNAKTKTKHNLEYKTTRLSIVD